MSTQSLDGGYTVSDKRTAERFVKGYEASIDREEKLPDAIKILNDGRRYLDLGK
ncbi:MAG: hypothetical protein FWD37_06855 [Methanomassiliicoccaceae archaeon]|nr:hypothetical protein [Methanomassiliicoccaceae archaeon]